MMPPFSRAWMAARPRGAAQPDFPALRKMKDRREATRRYPITCPRLVQPDQSVSVGSCRCRVGSEPHPRPLPRRRERTRVRLRLDPTTTPAIAEPRAGRGRWVARGIASPGAREEALVERGDPGRQPAGDVAGAPAKHAVLF